MKIYLACPYTHELHSVRRSRFEGATYAAGMIMKAGHYVYSPITHIHPIAEIMDLPKEWEFLQGYDTTFIEWAEELWVYQLEGWVSSVGVQAEINIAGKANKPIRGFADHRDLQNRLEGIKHLRNSEVTA